MKTTILILSLAISLLSCKDKAIKPQRSAGMISKAKPFSSWRINPLGYHYELTYAMPYVNYLGGKTKTLGC